MCRINKELHDSLENLNNTAAVLDFLIKHLKGHVDTIIRDNKTEE